MSSSPAPSQDLPPERAPKGALIVMTVILVVMALVAIYANLQRLRRDQTETVIITPASPSPTATMP